ncbi:MAG: glycosyltransferase family 4 protein [Nitratireductor sp.]
MNITIVYRYFWPDTAPYSLLLEKMVPWLVEDGHSVNVYTAQPVYSAQTEGLKSPKYETVFGAKVKRAFLFSEKGTSILKALNMFLFAFGAGLQILFGKKQDICWVGTTPPVMQAFILLIACKLRGTKLLYQMQDIHPEIAIHAGIMRPSIVTKALAFIDNITLRNADCVTVLSDDMKNVIVERSNSKARIEVINNFALGDVEAKKVTAKKNAVAKQSGKNKKQPVRFVYAGNVGNFQNLEAFVEAFSKVDALDGVLDVVGDGKALPSLQAYCEKNDVKNVVFHGRKSASDTYEFLKGCDVGLISLSPNLYKYAYPTKTHTYLAANLRLFAMVEDECQLANIIRDNALGVSLPWGSGQEVMIDKINKLIKSIKSSTKAHKISKEIWHANGARTKWQALLKQLNVEEA